MSKRFLGVKIFFAELFQLVTCGIEITFAREVEEDAECAEHDPEIEVRIAETECEDESEERRDLAESAAEYETGLDAPRVLIACGAFDVLMTEDEREKKECDRRSREDEYYERDIAEERRRSFMNEDLGPGKPYD